MQLPLDAQSSHWYTYAPGLPDHWLLLAVSVLPTSGVPEIVGRELFAGVPVVVVLP